MIKSRSFLGCIAMVSLSGTAFGNDLQPDPKSLDYCSGFKETIEGYWLNAGKPALLWRMGSNENGSGCYTVLHTYAPWGITEYGEIPLKKVEWNDKLRDAGCVDIDLANSSAEFSCQGAFAKGKVLRAK